MSVKIAILSSYDNTVATLDISLLSSRTSLITSVKTLNTYIQDGIKIKASEAEIRAFVDAITKKQGSSCHATRKYVEKVAKLMKVTDNDWENYCIDDMITISDREKKVSYSFSLSQLAIDYEYFESLRRTPLSCNLLSHTLDLNDDQIRLLYQLHTETDDEYDYTAEDWYKAYYNDLCDMMDYLQSNNDKWLMDLAIDMMIPHSDLSIDLCKRIGRYCRLYRNSFFRENAERFQDHGVPLAHFSLPISMPAFSKSHIEYKYNWWCLTNNMLSDPMTHPDVVEELNSMSSEELIKYTDDPVWCVIYGMAFCNVIPTYKELLELEAMINPEDYNKYITVIAYINSMKQIVNEYKNLLMSV